MKILAKLDRWQLMIAGVALAIIALATIGDAAVKQLTGRPIIGIYDVVQAALVFAMFLGLPEVFRTKANVTVDLIAGLLSRSGARLLDRLGTLVSIAYLGVLLLACIPVAWDVLIHKDYMPDSGIPVWVVWTPIIYSVALSLVAAVAALRTPWSGDEGVEDHHL